MFICSKCDTQSLKWAGKCLECESWGTLNQQEEHAIGKTQKASKKAKGVSISSLKDQAGGQDAKKRWVTGDDEIDRVLGGGLVKGSIVLLSGEPGIGKSTMVAGIASRLSTPTQKVLYVSGEESASQLNQRIERVGKKDHDVYYLESRPIETLVATIEKEAPEIVIVDSVQTLTSSSLDSTAGGATLVRYATSLLLELAKRTGVSILLIGQVTKDGSIAGPKTLEHLVDVVLSLEGDAGHSYRLLISRKNRFGATDEVGVFEMNEEGLVAVQNPSSKFIEERTSVAGSVIAATLEGSRVFLVEVQALVEKSAYGTPVRRASGFDQNRLQMLIAILSKRLGLKLGEHDVYLNVIGGMRLKEPAVDLAICAAIHGAATDTITASPTLYIGEVGLGGEVRSVPAIEKRIKEAERVGIESVMTPKTKKVLKSKINIIQTQDLKTIFTRGARRQTKPLSSHE